MARVEPKAMGRTRRRKQRTTDRRQKWRTGDGKEARTAGDGGGKREPTASDRSRVPTDSRSKSGREQTDEGEGKLILTWCKANKTRNSGTSSGDSDKSGGSKGSGTMKREGRGTWTIGRLESSRTLLEEWYQAEKRKWLQKEIQAEKQKW